MKNFLKKYPLHSFLVGLYFVYFIFVNNYHKVTLPMTFRSVFASLILAVFVFGLSYILFRSERRAGLSATLFLIGFYSYGYLSMMITESGLWPFPHLHRMLMGSFLVIYAALVFAIARAKSSFLSLNYVLNVLTIALLLVNTFFLFQAAAVNPPAERNPFQASAPLPGERDPADSLPDVYYIVLDGFASEQTLKGFYGDKDPLLYKWLRGNGFYVADSSFANYHDTSPSLASSLNMEYLPGSVEQPVMIRQNNVSLLFKKLGYRIVNMESGFVVSDRMEYADKTIDVDGPNEFELYILRYTFLMVVDMFRISNYTRLKSQVERLPAVVNEKGPKFAFIHIVSPHPPYIVDEHGNRTTLNAVSDSWEPREYYAGQVKYISKKIIDLISMLQKSKGRKPVIILQSDHGPWLKDSPANVYNARAAILNAYYVPEKINQKLYPTITPVNSFRLLFSELYQLPLPLLSDTPASFNVMSVTSAFRLYTNGAD